MSESETVNSNVPPPDVVPENLAPENAENPIGKDEAPAPETSPPEVVPVIQNEKKVLPSETPGVKPEKKDEGKKKIMGERVKTPTDALDVPDAEPGPVISKHLEDLDRWEKLMDKMDSVDGISTGSETSDDEEEEYKPPAVCKLRALARVVMINLRWAKDIRKAHEYQGFESFCTDEHTGAKKVVFFRVNDFMASRRVISGLTEAEKHSLKLHPIARTPEDLDIVSKVLERYKCFDKFTPEVRNKLAVWARYDSFDDARPLLRQGHEPYSMYFILTGSVSFKASDTDSRTGRKNYYPLGVRGPNSIIGEIELLNVDERRSTGTTQGDVELLRVDEDPFNEILRSSFEALFDERFAVLRSAQIFESWTDAELKILNENSSVITFEANKPILTDVFGPSAFSYFIQKGRCSMVKDVVFERSYFGKDFRNPLYQALDPEDERRWIPPSKLKEHPELEGHHLHITEFKEGDYFGVGENLRRSHIITLTTLECLTIPRSVFEKANRNQFLEDLKADLEDAIPSDEQILAEWLALQSWKTYKKAHLRNYWTKLQAEENAKFFTMYRKYRLNSLK